MPKNDVFEPKVSAPGLERKRENNQAVNPPSYMQLGGLTGASKLNRDDAVMGLEKGGPQAKQGKPI
jgi:hypothetical protein